MKTQTKNPHAVALGRIGGSKSSPAKRSAAKRNILKRWRKRKDDNIKLTGFTRHVVEVGERFMFRDYEFVVIYVEQLKSGILKIEARRVTNL